MKSNALEPRCSIFGLLASLLLVVLAQDACPQGPTFPNTAKTCNAWHTVVDGDDCSSVPQKYGKTLQEFLTWNPDVSSDCLTNFWLGNAYCVGVGTSSCPSSTVTTSSTTKQSTSTMVTTSRTISSVNATYSTRWPVTDQNLTTIPVETAWPPTRTQAGQPESCRSWHLVNSGDDCQSIINQAGGFISMSDFLSWNPSLESDCSGLYVGWWVCDSVQPQTSLTLTWSTSATNASVPPATEYTPPTPTSIDFSFTPSPVQSGIPSSCQAYYLAKSGDTCRTILAVYTYITQDQFMQWNPALQSNCDGLWADTYYCVANFGDFPPLPTVTVKPTSGIADGIAANCVSFYMAVGEDSCDSIVRMFGTFISDDFIAWNPSVWSGCSNIQKGIFYCVGVPGTPTSRPSVTSTTQRPPASTPSGCTRTWLVGVDDTCASIADSNAVSVEQLMAWNPPLGTGTAVNCTITPNVYLCVALGDGTQTPIFDDTGTTAVSSAQSTTFSITATSEPTTTTTSKATSTTSGEGVTTPLPFQAGMVDGCIRFYYTQDGDGCWVISNAAGISLDNFYKWNPGVGTDCLSMWVNSYVCIGISGSPTTITSGPPVPAQTS